MVNSLVLSTDNFSTLSATDAELKLQEIAKEAKSLPKLCEEAQRVLSVYSWISSQFQQWQEHAQEAFVPPAIASGILGIEANIQHVRMHHEKVD